MTEITQQPRRSPLRRVGCITALIVWFLILLLPCFLVVLAVQQEITISTGSAPGQQLRLWLISEPDQRGIALSTASVRETDPNAICVQTNIQFLLWSGSAEPLVYCDCFERESDSAAWSATSTTSGECTG